MIAVLDNCGGLHSPEKISDMVKEMEKREARAATSHDYVNGGYALRERICMALIASPCIALDVVERAMAIESYITGLESSPKAAVDKAANQASPILLQEGITALIETRFPHVKVVNMVVAEPRLKSMDYPYGCEGRIIINLELK